MKTHQIVLAALATLTASHALAAGAVTGIVTGVRIDQTGKAVYAMVLAAKAQGSTITAYGLGTCSIFGSYVEDWDYGTVQ